MHDQILSFGSETIPIVVIETLFESFRVGFFAKFPNRFLELDTLTFELLLFYFYVVQFLEKIESKFNSGNLYTKQRRAEIREIVFCLKNIIYRLIYAIVP